METLTQRARDHYRLVLLRNKGITPWSKFVVAITKSRTLADKTRSRFLAKRTFGKWRVATGQRSMARENMGDELRRQQQLRKYVKAWKQVSTTVFNLFNKGHNLSLGCVISVSLIDLSDGAWYLID